MTTSTKSIPRKLLYGGGDLCINRMGDHYSVDVFDGENPEPVYHAFYDNLADAQADADSWRGWET